MTIKFRQFIVAFLPSEVHFLAPNNWFEIETYNFKKKVWEEL